MNENTLPKKRGLTKKAIPVEKKPSRAKAITAFVVLALGLAIMPSGFLLANVVQGEIDKGIADAVAVPHPHNKEFEEWETNDYKGAPELYKSFNLWNLTNTEGALKGDIPTYVEEGPFVFREFNYKYNIDFSRDKDEVTFKEYSTFIQVGGDPISDVYITNVNPAILGSIMEAGGTAPDLNKLIFPMLLTEVRMIFVDELNVIMEELLTEEGISNMLIEKLPEMLGDLLGGLDPDLLEFIEDLSPILIEAIDHILPMSLIADLMKDSMPEAEDIFYEEWANDYFPEIDVDLTEVMIYLQENLDLEDLKDFIYALAEGLFDHDSLIIKILGVILGVIGWFIDILDIVLGWLVDALLDWLLDLLAGSALQVMLEDLLADFIRDLGAGLVDEEGGPEGKGVDIDGREPYNFNNYPGASPTDLNISDHEKGGSGISLETSRILWDKENPNSLNGFDFLENKIWYDAVEGDIESKNDLMIEFDLTETQIDLILNWIDVGLHTWGKNAAGWVLDDWNAGLIVTRSVEDWLFTANDTAVYKHQAYYGHDVSLAYVGIYDNCHNTVEADEAGVPTITMKTGRDDASKAHKIKEYNSEDEIYIWTEPIEVKGTDGTKFGPGVTEDDTLKVFNLDLMRTVELEFDEEDEIYDINLLRFELSEDNFAPNPTYYMDTTGLINLAPVEKYRDVPVRVTKPHFLDTDIAVQQGINGMMPNSRYHDTYIGVEPISGLTMKARQRVQINFDLWPMEIWYTNITGAVMPILWTEDSGEISEELAEEFIKVYGAMELKEALPLMCLGVGAALCLPGTMVSTSQSIKRENAKKSTMAKQKKLSLLKKQKLLSTIDAPEVVNNETPKLKGDGSTSLKSGDVPKSESAKDLK